MTPTEIAALPKGTEVFVRYKLNGRIDRDGFVPVLNVNGFGLHVTYAGIECVAPPKPVPVKVGDLVTWGSGSVNFTILATSETEAWLQGTAYTTTHTLSDLRPATPTRH